MPLRRQRIKVKPLRNREELLQSIVRDRSLLSNYFDDLATKESQSAVQIDAPTVATPNAPMQQRDSYDLFFESACISVKSLPPKLAAEAKSRISQIITEFELRAISEHEAQLAKEKQQMAKNNRVSNEAADDPSSEIVYEFQAYS